MPRKGFKLPERVVTLFFEDGPYEGLELEVVLNVPLGYWFQVAESHPMTKVELKKLSTAAARDIIMDWPRRVLRGWNLEDSQGNPIPATPEAFADEVDVVAQAQIRTRWLEAVANPPIPLSPQSSAGDTSVPPKKSRRR